MPTEEVVRGGGGGGCGERELTHLPFRPTGIIKQTKANTLATEAERAITEGRTVFAPMLNTPATHHSFSGAVAGWAEMIEAVEEKGWTLTQWSVARDNHGQPQAYPLFRRA
jgi:hypothetical protein